jgi:hypothetical protein
LAVRIGLCVIVVCALAACGPPTPAALPPPIAASPAQKFLDAFAEAESRVEPGLRVHAQNCANAGRFYTCALTAPAPTSTSPKDMRLTLTLDGAVVTATTLEASPADAAAQFATLSAIATSQGEPLNTNATITAFKRDLGFDATPKAGRRATATRTYGEYACALDERGVHVCTITPKVATGDLPPPAGAMVRARGAAR